MPFSQCAFPFHCYRLIGSVTCTCDCGSRAASTTARRYLDGSSNDFECSVSVSSTGLTYCVHFVSTRRCCWDGKGDGSRGTHTIDCTAAKQSASRTIPVHIDGFTGGKAIASVDSSLVLNDNDDCISSTRPLINIYALNIQ